MKIEQFRKKFTVNLASVVIPAVISILAIPFLFRVTTTEIAGIIMWTWFLGASASAVNVGLVPSLTNNLGHFCNNEKIYNHLLKKYISASNSIFFVLGILFIFYNVFKSTPVTTGDVIIKMLQFFYVWLTGIASLIITALNYESKFITTGKVKLIGNTFILITPVFVAFFSENLVLIILSIFTVKLIQTSFLLFYTKKNSFFLDDIARSNLLNFSALKNVFTINKPLIIITFLQFMYSFIDRAIIMISGGASAYAEYGALLDIITKPWLVANIFIIILHPALSSANTNGLFKIKATITHTKNLLLLTAPFLIIFLIFTDFFLGILFDRVMTDTLVYSAKIIAVGVLLSLFIILPNVLFIATEDYFFLLSVTIIVFILYSLLAYPVFVNFGIIGLASMLLVKFILEFTLYSIRLFFSCQDPLSKA